MLPYSKYYVLGAIRIYYRDLVSIGMCFKKQSHLGIPIQTWVLDLTAWSMDHIRGILFQAVLQHACHLFKCCICYMYIHISMLNDSTPTHSQQLQLFNLQLLSFDPQATNVQFGRVSQFFPVLRNGERNGPRNGPAKQEAYDRVRSRIGSASIFPTIDEKVRKFPEKGRTEDSCNET